MVDITQRLPVAPDAYGWARFPETERRIEYGRFRNVYLYITEVCQLRCSHCYMGERLESARVMPLEKVRTTLALWRKMGGSKLTLLGGEPTTHPHFRECVQAAYELGYEKVIVTTNGLGPARRGFLKFEPSLFNYVQISLDGGSHATHDLIRGPGTFRYALETARLLCRAGYDIRFICTVSRKNMADCLDLIRLADEIGATLVKYHVFSTIGTGKGDDSAALTPIEWVEFCDLLKQKEGQSRCQIWYQPTYARIEDLPGYYEQGYRGCVGRTMDRISIFPDGRCYICSYLFDTDFHFCTMDDEGIALNPGTNEFTLFAQALSNASRGSCKSPAGCCGGCPAEKYAMGAASCETYPDIVPVCRLWKSDTV
ncbi:radical SAM protein [Luteibacter sp.]|jgi:radical SAM protein with 4Fe4S-binding SPASM domain|uniref:radical SAM protein n=1 Tax=Luteibacter sp. TaxID=1886636 RepID=UPI002F3FD70D